MNSPIQYMISAHGVDLAVYEWGVSRPDKPDVIFFHATGFHGRCWDQVIKHLNDLHCYAMDTRGHGRSDKSAYPFTWADLGRDAAAVVRELNVSNALGIGHSSGGNMLTCAAAANPGAFGALLLVDPAIFPLKQYSLHSYTPDNHFVMRRRTQWGSVDEMVERFRNREPFNRWQPEVLRDYCEYGLLPSSDGEGYVLACPPIFESNIYNSARLAQNSEVYESVPQIDVPVRVLRSGMGTSESSNTLMLSPTAPDLAEQFQQGEDVVLRDNSHFIPMESPDVVAWYIQDMISKLHNNL